MVKISPSLSDRPIGILDSGLGGLTIWQEIRHQLPGESTIYIGDQAHQPYGGRSSDTIRRRVKRLIRFLLDKGAKLVVVACNTATVAGIERYRQWFPSVPVIGVVPVVKTAALMTKTKHIAVLSTPYTAASRYQKRLIKTFAGGSRVENIGVPALATLIENGAVGSVMTAIVRKLFTSDHMRGVDVVALGCTHYPFIRQQIAAAAGKDVAVIDSGGAVARQTNRILDANSLRAGKIKPYTVFYTTGDARRVSRVAGKLMHENIQFAYARV